MNHNLQLARGLRVVTPPPAVVHDKTGRLVLIDDAVLAPMRGQIPADEPLQTEERRRD